MSVNLSRWALALAIPLAACHINTGGDGGDDTEDPGADLSGATFEGDPPDYDLGATGTAYFFPYQEDEINASIQVVLADVGWTCDELRAWDEGQKVLGGADVPIALTVIAVAVFDGQGFAATPIIGPYLPFEDLDLAEGRGYFTSRLHVGDLGSVYASEADVYEDADGAVTVSAYDPQERIEGTFDIDYAEGHDTFTITGTFDATYCPL